MCVTLSVLVCFYSRLCAGVGLKISGGEALLLGCVSVARCWFSMLLMEAAQVLLKFVASRIRRRHGFKILLLIKLERLEGRRSDVVDVTSRRTRSNVTDVDVRVESKSLIF